MPKLKKMLTPDEAKKQFHAPIEKKKKIQAEQTERTIEIEAKKALKEAQKNVKAKYFAAYRTEAMTETRRKRLAKSIRAWLSSYLDSRYSVRDFERWRKQKPAEALPWAWKVVYGDGQGALGPQAGQVNVLIKILTGRNPAPLLIEPDIVPRGTIDNIPQPSGRGNQLPQAIENQSSDTLVVTVPLPENPENR